MNSNTSIYQELKETAPQLANVGSCMPYVIPKDYFQNFYSEFANHLLIHEVEVQLPKTIPYVVPTQYFDQLSAQIFAQLNKLDTVNTTAQEEELVQIAPFLAKMSRQMPYTLPAQVQVNIPRAHQQATVVSFAKSIRWWYAAAACIVTIMLLTGIWRYQKVQQSQQVARAEIGMRINQLSDAELASYLLNEGALPANTDVHDMANIPVEALFNLQEHLQMCTEEELNAFLKDNELTTSKRKVSKGG